MRITFLLMSADSLGGTERAIFSQASLLCDQHKIEVLSVFRNRESAFFHLPSSIAVNYLVDNTGLVPRPTRVTRLSDDECATLSASEPRLINRRWERSFSRLAELELEHALRNTSADVVVSTTPALMAAMTSHIAPTILSIHQEHRPTQLRGGTGDPIFQFAPRLDALVVLTERTRGWLVDSLRTAAPDIRVIPNVLSADYRPKSSRTARIVTIAGRLVPEKQVDHAVRAFAPVADAHPDWILRVIGDGPQLGELRRLTQALDLQENVQFLGATSSMSAEWSKSAIALSTSRDGEALPLVLIEAFAAGVPAVSYDVHTGPAEIIDHGCNGFLVGPGDIEGISAAILRLIEDGELRDLFGLAALESARAYYPSAVLPQWLSLYQELAGTRDDPTRIDRKADRALTWEAVSGGSGLAMAVPVPDSPLRRRAVRDREEILARENPSYERAGGRLAFVADTLLPSDVLDWNLRLVADAFERRSVEYLFVRDNGPRPRLAVDDRFKDVALAALDAELATSVVYAEILSPTGVPSGVTLIGQLLESEHGHRLGGLRIFRPVVSSTGTLRYGPAYGCDVEFWRHDSDALVRPLRRTLIGDSIPSEVFAERTEIQFGSRRYPTVEAFTATLVGDLEFEIDVVYTWVDGSDPAWLSKKAGFLSGRGEGSVQAASGDARFRNQDELLYSLRSVAMFAPWVRKIWIVSDDQIPEWLNLDHPQVQIVTHKQLFGDRGALPTFNSHAIETQLHHIDGLAEHFLYFNDDVFLGRPLRPDVFFSSNGTSQFFLSPTAVPMLPVCEDDDFNFSAAKNNRRLVFARFGHTLTHAFLHAPHALLRSVLTEIESAYPEAIAQTASSQLRSATDVSVPSSLHHYYAYFTKRATRGRLRAAYVDIGDASQHPLLTQILTMRGLDVFCLNDTHHSAGSAAQRAAIAELFLRSYFPIASPYERPRRQPRTSGTTLVDGSNGR